MKLAIEIGSKRAELDVTRKGLSEAVAAGAKALKTEAVVALKTSPWEVGTGLVGLVRRIPIRLAKKAATEEKAQS